MAFIWQDKKFKTWYVDYTPPGGKRCRERIGKSKQVAQQRLKDIEYRLSIDRAGIADPKVTVRELMEKFEETTRSTVRPKSLRKYQDVLQHFRAFLGPRAGKMLVRQVTSLVIEEYITWRREGNSGFEHRSPKNGNGAKAKTINTEVDILGTLFNRAKEWHFISESPVKNVRRLKEDDSKPFRFFSLEEIEVLRLVADGWDEGESDESIDKKVTAFHRKHRDLKANGKCSVEGKRNGRFPRLLNARAIVELLLGTGAREDELLEMEWSWLDLKQRVVHLRQRTVWRPNGQEVGWTPKGAEGSLKLRPNLVKHLRKVKRSPNCPKVFRDASGKPIPARTFERMTQRLITTARLRHATLHTFRHTFASHLAMSGVPLPTIQRLLRHRNIQTVMIYAHLSPKHVEEAVVELPY